MEYDTTALTLKIKPWDILHFLYLKEGASKIEALETALDGDLRIGILAEMATTQPLFNPVFISAWTTIPKKVKQFSAAVFHGQRDSDFINERRAFFEFLRQYWQHRTLGVISETHCHGKNVTESQDYADLLAYFDDQIATSKLAQDADFSELEFIVRQAEKKLVSLGFGWVLKPYMPECKAEEIMYCFSNLLAKGTSRFEDAGDLPYRIEEIHHAVDLMERHYLILKLLSLDQKNVKKYAEQVSLIQSLRMCISTYIKIDPDDKVAFQQMKSRLDNPISMTDKDRQIFERYCLLN